MPGWFELKKADNGQFSFSLKNADGETLLRSEQYKARDSAINGIASVQKNCALDQRYNRLNAADGRCYFNLKAANHQVIGTSSMFADTQSSPPRFAAPADQPVPVGPAGATFTGVGAQHRHLAAKPAHDASAGSGKSRSPVSAFRQLPWSCMPPPCPCTAAHSGPRFDGGGSHGFCTPARRLQTPALAGRRLEQPS